MAHAPAPAGPVAASRRGPFQVKWVCATTFLAVTLAGAVAAGIVGSQVKQVSGSGYGEILLVLLFTAVGGVLAIRRPRNPIGWLFLSVGVCFVLTSFATSYTVLDYVHRHGTLPFGWVALLLAEFWAPAIALLSVAALLFPDGRPGSRTSRFLLAALFLAALVWQVGAFGIAVSAIVSHRIHIDSGGDLYAIDHAVGPWAWWYSAAQPAFFLTLAAVWLGWLVQQVPAYRRSTGDRRLQLKWLYGGVTVCGVGGILIAAFTSASGPLHAIGVLGDVMLCALPLSVGIALLKFRLYEIDKVVSRTVTYGLVSAWVVGAYVGIVALLTRSVGLSSPIAVAASTLAAACLFNPLRRRVQRAVDHRFNRARIDAEATVGAFVARLREAVEFEAVRAEFLGVIHSTIEPTHLALWVSPAADARLREAHRFEGDEGGSAEGIRSASDRSDRATSNSRA